MDFNKLTSIRWFVSLGAKFVRVVPSQTFFVIMLTLFSQFASVLAFVLPLKIIFLLGSDRVPHYFPSVFSRVEHDLLVVYLSIATVGFFIAHVLTEKLIDRITGIASRVLISRSGKIILFENQEELASNAYGSFSRALTGAVFAFLAITALIYIYTDMALVLVGYIVLAFFITYVLCRRSHIFLGKFEADPNALMSLLSAIGFFTIFGYLVVDFVWLSPPGLIMAIVAMLLARQSFNRLVGMVNGLVKLSRQRIKLDALFFHGKVLVSVEKNLERSIWSYLSPANRASWIGELLKDYIGSLEITNNEITDCLVWQQPALNNMGMLNFTYGENVYLIKIYGEKLSSLALHESSLLTEHAVGLPAPAWIGATKLGDYHCSISRFTNGHIVDESSYGTKALELRKKLLVIEPPIDLAQRYLRSKPILPQRMSLYWLDLLEVAILKKEEQYSFDFIKENWQLIKNILTGLPLSFHVPAISPHAIWVEQSGNKPLLLHWERWGIEPIGAGWPRDQKQFNELYDEVAVAAAERTALQSVSYEALQLSILMSELDRLIQKQSLRAAVKILPDISSSLSRIYDAKEESETA